MRYSNQIGSYILSPFNLLFFISFTLPHLPLYPSQNYIISRLYMCVPLRERYEKNTQNIIFFISLSHILSLYYLYLYLYLYHILSIYSLCLFLLYSFYLRYILLILPSIYSIISLPFIVSLINSFISCSYWRKK